ncbi:MAG: glutamine--fructose-6-phosphate aminotransferase, partial [Ottowia sp.]|nr:glutamine--fructose-6-phosphate aminotransferase [Ottowia sp.]
MCGIVSAISQGDIVPFLIEGLQRLEYRGYDSCGVAVQGQGAERRVLRRVRGIARVADLAAQCAAAQLAGTCGIAHTRWATHGAPAVGNAHPHFSMGPHGA